MTEKKETRIERRERERREEDERDRVARELRRSEEDRWRKLREDWRKEQEVMKKKRKKWNDQREEFKKLQDEEGKKLNSLKCAISTNENYPRTLHSRNANAEREIRCLLDQQVAAIADCVRIAKQRDRELQRLAVARVEGVREEDNRAARL